MKRSLLQVLCVSRLLLFTIALSSYAVADEFSHSECEFKVNFPFPISVKKIVQPLGNGVYSNTFMAKAGDSRVGRMYSANCDTYLRFAPNATMSQKRKLAEWSIKKWAELTGLRTHTLYWEQRGEHTTLKLVGKRTMIEAGKRISLAIQSRMYIGHRSTMVVSVGESAAISPSAEMEKFLNYSVKVR